MSAQSWVGRVRRGRVHLDPDQANRMAATLDRDRAFDEGDPLPPAWHWLFRYSALTFNGHRIHYDVDYCRAVEGYPDLVVHGPLLATLLLDLAVREDRPLARFTYRARNPLFLPHPFTVNGRPDGGDTVLWAADHGGDLAMEAHAYHTG